MICSLDLYAKIEPLIGFYEEYEELYCSYLELLLPLHVKSVLDIGCGNGKLLKLLEGHGFDAFGIDRSEEMIKRAKELGVEASGVELLNLPKSSFDSALAVGDVLNYMCDDEIDQFFAEVKAVLKKDGYFLADINTKSGFEMSDGVMARDLDDSFLSIEANYDDEVLTTDITLFERDKGAYHKSTGQVLQYFHEKERFENLESFKLLSSFYISMFGEEDEKLIMLFQAT